MDKTSNSTTVPAVSTALRVSHSLSMSALASMRMRDLLTLNDVMVHIETSLTGFINQPRCIISKTGENNDAGEVVETLLNRIYECRDLVVGAARNALPVTSEDIQDRAWLLVREDAKCAESLSGITALAAQEAVKLSDALWSEEHAERLNGGA
ncbi:hypothetical protein FY145_01215 [Agrobacterium tumefaciens]|uniref:hypothetical protein n=1 Tax=Agrobacterium tumefaciens TaxID=358 RepID=UPI0021D29359|nr:hypothetical protein [Agrobacterium tumefaciens]UXS69190.1 hypothetical protein FY146_01215 [Agrobacterium tumefaciens]UXS76853.1 hypothetical protein FY145_01215 [Agrobacterium tumefaciens]